MAMRKSEFVFILLAAAVVFFILGYFIAGKTQGRSFTVSAENSGYTPALSDSGSSPAPGGVQENGGTGDSDPLDINSASASELAALPGISSELAEKIVSYRETYGPFDYPERLLRISGIDRELFLQIEQYIYAG